MKKDVAESLQYEPMDHEGTARCVLAMFPGIYKFTSTHGWMVYNGRFWEMDGGASVGRAIVKTLRLREEVVETGIEDEKVKRNVKRLLAANSFVVNGVRSRLQEQKEVYCSIDDFDNYPDKLNCNNGLLDLRTGELEDHSPDQLLTYCLNLDYNPDASCDEWVQFVSQVVKSDIHMFLQIASGYFLTGHTVEECLFYGYGPTRSGKGTFTETITAVMQSLSVGLNFKTFTAERSADTQNFDLAPLKNKRLVVASESRKNERLNEAVLKQVTGGDNIYCAHKNKPHFSYKPQFKIMLMSNHPANTDPTDAAAWGRLRVISFPNSFLGKEDKALKRRLKERDNLEGVLAWMVQGAMYWYEAGLPVPDSVIELTNKQQIMSNSVAMFVDQCCSIETDGFEPGTPLYKEYKDWCKDEGYQPLGRKNFTIALNDLGIESDRQTHAGKVSRGFVGIDYSGYGLGDEAVTKGIKYGLKVSENGQSVSAYSTKLTL
jgi:putative DNA primase/helicase